MNRTNIFLVNRILTGCLSEAENLVILFFDVVTGMPSRKSHLLPAAVSSLESVTASFGSKVEVWLAPGHQLAGGTGGCMLGDNGNSGSTGG